MLVESLTALAAAGGTAVVQAAGTDAWTGLREAVACWFGRGDSQREQAELERLDRTAAALEAADPAQVERARVSMEAAWQARIEATLEHLDGPERDQAADQLRALLVDQGPGDAVSAGPGGVAVKGHLDIRADQGSIAAAVIQDARIGPHPMPDPPQD
ncbi:hypothetical protein AQJ46_47980 [Streptomyces canus]|uniref:Uncharacterized protein n=1 Tax=Streptomyces canus TaxID=58343 RepID=A0A101RL32_9ACTN|nr:hypothetical protein [Streptomyces canus]KUN57298.1 hypothetical protein AQJ46_47980 [Streptomyces canus]